MRIRGRVTGWCAAWLVAASVAWTAAAQDPPAGDAVPESGAKPAAAEPATAPKTAQGGADTVGAGTVVTPTLAAEKDAPPQLTEAEKAADVIRMSLGFYIGGMGAREVNFHADLFSRMGYEEDVERIQDLFLGGRKEEAIASVPLALVEDVALVGPEAKIRDDLERWRDTCITTLLVAGAPDQMRRIADLVRG